MSRTHCRILVKARNVSVFFFALWAAFLPGSGDAATPSLAAPQSVRLTPTGARLAVEQTLPVETADGVSCVHLALPAGAEGLQIAVEGQTVARWQSKTLPHADSGGMLSERFRKMEEIQKTEAALALAKARLSLLIEHQPASGTFEDMARQEKRLTEVVPQLHEECADLAIQLSRLQKELKELPPDPGPGRLVVVTLSRPVKATSLAVRYAYTLSNCGWRPIYVLDAHPDASDGGHVAVRFLAEMWQHSGMDWDKAQLTLVSSAGSGRREPDPLPRWVLEARDEAPLRAMAHEDSAMPMAAKAAANAAQEPALEPAVRAETNAVYATWRPAVRGLPEGRSRLTVLEETWQTPLQWLARPSRGEGRVWLTARCQLPADRAWPVGRAEYQVDGQNVGSGRFAPKGQEAELFFGPDPRVQVRAVQDTRTRAEEGFINKSRVWKWGWTYEVRNMREREVTVRLERPMPQVVNKEIHVTYADAPKPHMDKRERKLVWEVNVPAHGKAEVRHAIEVTSPKEMLFSPYVP